MTVTRHVRLEMELVHWLLLVLAAIALVLAIATALAAADPMMEPRLLPDDMGIKATPMAETVRPFFQENPPARELPPAEAAARLRTILDSHRAGRVAEALAGWEQIRLPEETAHWREIAIGAAYLRIGNQERAAIHLGVAQQMAPRQAVVAFYMGLLRLEQAESAGRAPDAPQGRHDKLVAYTPAEDKALYQMLAMVELREAIAHADAIQLNEPLVAIDSQIEEAAIVPIVSDLLVALGADNFVGKAHNTLFGLLIKRGELTDAEFHLDRAAATGMAVLDGYRDLAAAYLDEGRSADVLRVAGKDLGVNLPWVRPLWERLAERCEELKAVWVW